MSTFRIKKLTDSGDWVTQTEAARLRQVSPAAISLLLRRGRLRSKVIAGRRLIHRKDVLNFHPLARGRPTKSMREAALAVVDREEWITQKEAAKIRGITPNGIRTAVKRGRIRFLKKGDVSFVNKQDVLNYRPRIDFHPESGSQSALPVEANPKEWITVAEAARLRGVSQSMITKHATGNRIRSIKTGNTRLIYREDILNFKRKPGPGRPKKK